MYVHYKNRWAKRMLQHLTAYGEKKDLPGMYSVSVP
jgi:hypothetical protein